MEIQEQFESVLALQEVPVETEDSSDDTEADLQDTIVWGHRAWCRISS